MQRNNLKGKQKAFLRSLGQKEEPVVQIGKDGVTPTVVKAAREALNKRELIKVKVQQNAPQEPKEHLILLAERTESELVQIIGRMGLLWRQNFDKPHIHLPH